MNDEYRAILFPSTNHTLRGEKVLQRAGVQARIIPVPRHLSSDCGISIRIAVNQEERARTAMNEASLEFRGIYPLQ